MFKRPKPGEDEDDILRMQEEFLREKNKNKNMEPAAKVVNLRGQQTTSTKRSSSSGSGTRKPSKYAQSKGLTNYIEKRPRIEEQSTSLIGDIVEKNLDNPEPHLKTNESQPENTIEDDKVYYPTILPTIVGNIVERNEDTFVDNNPLPMPSQGFPVVTKHDMNIEVSSRSIFSIHMADLKQNKVLSKQSIMDIDKPTSSKAELLTHSSTHIDINVPMKSNIVTTNDSELIHKENVEVLGKMSEQEILEEQKKLLSELDPNIIAFLKSKRSSTPQVINQTASENDIAPQNKKFEKDTMESGHHKTIDMDIMQSAIPREPDIDDSLWENDVLSNPQISKWLHFDSLEKDKLAWMKCIEERKIINPNDPYEARFNFNGHLMPYTIDYTEDTKTLFHHGDEPHRPGYSLTELFAFSRSTVIQQRVMALNTLAGILQYYMAGAYKDIVELPLSKIFFVIRFAMDENKTIILEPALKAMRNLIYNRIEEASLDSLLGFEHGLQQPCLENDKAEIIELDLEESELKDFHLAEIDLTTAALRTDIIQRIHYILHTLRPTFFSVQYSLQILIRLARDSIDTAQKIVETDHLMKTIICNFIPVTSINFYFEPQIVYNGKPILAALKLFRILSLQSKEIAETLINKYDILKPLSEYISSPVDSTYGLRLQIEAFSLLSNFIIYNVGIENIISLFQLIVNALYKHVHATDIFPNSSLLSATHAAVILQLANAALNTNVQIDIFKPQLYSLILDGVKRWLGQFSNADAYTCGHLRLLCSALDCCRYILKTETHVASNYIVYLKFLSTSNGFNLLLNQLIPSSNLLSGIDNIRIHTVKNLLSLGTAVLDREGKVLPILNTLSPFPILISLFNFIETIGNTELFLIYVKKLGPYLYRIKCITPSLCDNWFTRMEVDFIYITIKLANASGNDSETDKDILYAVANKLCYILRADKKYELEFLFNNIVFQKSWFTTDRLMSLMTVSESVVFSKTLSLTENIKKCYSSSINVHNKETGPNIILRKWQDPILPRDWIYLPILKLYSKSQVIKEKSKVVGEHAKKSEALDAEEKHLVISCSLEWILINEQCFPELLKDINITDRFCRIMCIFLSDNSLFLDNKVKSLLHSCIQCLFKKEKSEPLDFDKPLVGLNNFQDFYTQFLEQFQSVSYGDDNFAACVLVPLAQKHDVKWRKLLWSEYAGCLRALDCPAEYLCYDLKDYFYPEETDESLLKSYIQALNGNLLRLNTIAYQIASHHVQSFKNRSCSQSTG